MGSRAGLPPPEPPAGPQSNTMESGSYEPPPCAIASSVFKRRGRWYARVTCPSCASSLHVKLSLGPMVAHCQDCVADVEADVRSVLTRGRA